VPGGETKLVARVEAAKRPERGSRVCLRPRLAEALLFHRSRASGWAETGSSGYHLSVATLTFPIDNALAQELGADRDRLLEAVAERAGARVALRGNEVITEGSDAAVAQVRLLLEELAGLVEQGLPVGQQTVEAVVGVLDAQGRAVDVLHDVVWRHRGKKIAPKTLNQKRYVDAIRSSTVTFGVGPAGTGKTYLAMALAVSALDDRSVARIILTRPAVEAGERLGFLPGDMLAKVDPYLRPLFDALYDMLDADRLAAYMEKGIIEVAPLAFMRGRTLNDSFIVLDEAQNTTPEQMQMFLTRLGFGSKIVVTGDPTQNDLARGERSGLADVSEVLPGIAGIEFVNFGSEDVVRHKLVQRIVSAYKERAEQRERSAR
jgi:phosphate starvation-inducible protein PhoH and related proteins